jgi:glycosyltransferase involved in cell wall biosynthesis
VKVLFAIDTLGSGGAQRQAVEIAVRLVERGEIAARFVVYHPDPFFRPRLEQAGIEITQLPKSLRYDPFFPRRMRADLRARPVDVVHAFLLPPGMWSLLACRGMPRASRPALIASERNDRIATSRFEAIVQRAVYRGADAVTVNAEPVAGEIERHLGVARERIRYIPNGIDLAGWDRAMRAECPLDLGPGLFHVGLVGRAAPQKHHELLIDALVRIERNVLRSWRVWLVGAGLDGERARRLQVRVRDAGLAEVVRFATEQRAIAAVMARLSLAVLTSRHEGFPNVVLEAMASSLPVIATRVGDVPNMIEPGRSGVIVPPGDAAALADALVAVFHMKPAEREALGRSARARVEECFAIDAIVSRYLELYREVAPSSS